MKLFVRFTDKPNVKVPINMKVLGEAWEENKDFYISINKDSVFPEKIDTFIEEFIHIFLRVMVFLTKKTLSIKQEHAFIKEVMELLKKYGILE